MTDAELDATYPDSQDPADQELKLVNCAGCFRALYTAEELAKYEQIGYLKWPPLLVTLHRRRSKVSKWRRFGEAVRPFCFSCVASRVDATSRESYFRRFPQARTVREVPDTVPASA